MSNNVQCLNCFKADKDMLSYLEEMIGEKKVFMGFLTESGILGLSLSAEITWRDGLVIAETVREMTSAN